MALDFPPSPALNDPYPPPPASPRWIWNGTSWVSAPAVTGLYLPLAGGTMTGPLGVNGNTALNADAAIGGDLAVQGDTSLVSDLSVSGATTLDGVTADAITLTAAPTQNMQVATKQYVDEEVAAGGLWKGTWDAENNVPDLTTAALQVNAWGWTVTTSDHTTPFEIPATPVIPGLNGLTVYDGDHVIWSDTASQFEVVHGSSLSLQEAKTMFGPRVATVVVGNSGMHARDSVDYWCDGTTDVATIQQAIDSLPAAGGKIVIREGNYNLDNPINVHTKAEVFIEGMGDATNFNLLDMPTSNNTQGWFEITTSAIFEHFHCTFTNQTQTDLARVMAVFHVSGGMFARFNYINFTGRNLAVNVSYVFRNININDWAWGVRNDWTVFEVFKCNLDFDNVANHILGAATIGVIGYFYIVYPPNPNVAVRRGVRGALKECVCKVKNNNQTTGCFRLAMNYSFNTWIENNYFEIDRTSTSLVSIGGGNPSFETHTVGNTIMCNEMYDVNADNIIGWGSGASQRHGHFMNNYIVVANMYNCSGGLVYMNGGLWARDNFIHVTVRTIGSRGAMNVFMTAGTYSGSTFDNNRISITRDDTTEPTVFPRSLFTSTNQSWATVQNVTIINNMINYSDTDPWYLWSDRSNSGFTQLIAPGGPGVQGNILAWNRSGLFAFTRF